MRLDYIRFPNEETREWLNARLNEGGPWSLKPTLQTKVNCLLHFYLATQGDCAHPVRGYLCDSDSPEVWMSSLENTILPYIANTLSETCHG